MTDLTNEMDEAWTSVERAIWPDGPAHGHGSGAYSGLKARIIAVLRATKPHEHVWSAANDLATCVICDLPRKPTRRAADRVVLSSERWSRQGWHVGDCWREWARTGEATCICPPVKVPE